MSRRRFQRFEEEPVFAQINVTPFVDVVLVVLVIFMVLGPTLAKLGFSVELPSASTAEPLSEAIDMTIVIDSGGRLFISQELTTVPQILQKLKQYQAQKKEVSLVVSADENVLYNQVVHLLDQLRAQGVTQFALELQQKP